MASPYQFNPLNFNPLRPLIDAHLDFDALASSEAIRLYVSAVNVRTGKVRVFENGELSAPVLMASACLPFLFQAITIDGEDYWDGGYAGNPSLFPLVKHCETKDIVIIQNNPISREELPVQSRDILNRMHEISFNTSLMLEMSMIQHINELVGHCSQQTKYREIYLHLVEGEQILKELGTSSKFNADWDFLKYLRALGDDAATQWYRENGKQLGKRSSGEALAQYQIH
jgi:NTE family protein